MAVVVLNNKPVELTQSLLHEEKENLKGVENVVGQKQLTGAIALDSSMKILPLISDYLSDSLINNKISIETAKTYGKNLIYFIDYLKKEELFKNDKLDESFLYVQEHKILEYYTHLQNTEKLDSQTISNRDAALQSFFTNYLCLGKANKPSKRADNPYDGEYLYSSTPNTKLPEMCSFDDLMSLIRCTEYERERVVLQFMYDSGVRRSEVPRVTKKHIEDALNSDSKNLIQDDVTVVIPSNYKRLYIEGSKGRKRKIKPRHTIVSIPTLRRVKRYLASPLYKKPSRKFGNSAPAFLNAEGGKFTSSSIGKLLERVSKRAEKRNYIKKPIHPHMIRHGFASAVLCSPDLGDDTLERLVRLQFCLGHNHLSTTQIYTSIPYDVYAKVTSKDGETMCRYEIMEKLVSKTRKTIKFGDTK